MMLNTTYELVGVGSPIIDVLAKVPESFLETVGGQKGGMVLVDAESIGTWMAQLPEPFTQAPGGSAGNTVFAASRLGMRTTFVGKTGNDAGGTFYRERLEALGGDASRFKTGDLPSGRCLSLITPDGERTMRTDLGAAATLTPGEVKTTDFVGCTHAHIEGYLLFNQDLMMAVLQAAREAGCTISLDLASFEVVEATRDVLPGIIHEYVDLLFANEEEAAAYFGGSGPGEDQALSLADMCELAVVKAGSRGAWLARKGSAEALHVPAVPGVRVVDTTGAGDYWAAGFLTGWLKGKPLETCAAWGARMGAEIIKVIGAELDEQTWETVVRELDIPG